VSEDHDPVVQMPVGLLVNSDNGRMTQDPQHWICSISRDGISTECQRKVERFDCKTEELTFILVQRRGFRYARVLTAFTPNPNQRYYSFAMANPEHLAILKQGIEAWNNWQNGSGVVADLRGANLRGANLSEATLLGANLIGATLLGANLREVNLIGATLRGATLRGANLSGANLLGANLIGANLRVANLRGANLREANLIGADLFGADLWGVTYNSGTRWPEGFVPEQYGVTGPDQE
jgi:hypothetical protein